MSEVGQKDILTQKRVIRFFQDQLVYDYLGDWTDREGNSNVDEGRLTVLQAEDPRTSAKAL